MIDLRIKGLNEKAETANSSGSSASGTKKQSISENEWSGLRSSLKEKGVTIEGAGKYGNFGSVLNNVNKALNSGCMISVTNENGEEEQVELNQAIADSYDSVLDIVLKEKLKNILGDGNWKIEDLKTPKMQAKLKAAGIEFTTLDKRIYTFSLVDADGKVIQDEDGKLAQIIVTDKVLPDGYMQGTDRNWNAVLDYVGYNCVSELDYTAEEMAQIRQLAELDNSQLGTSSGKRTSDIYKNAKITVAGSFGGYGGATLGSGAFAPSLTDDNTLVNFEQEQTPQPPPVEIKKEEEDKDPKKAEAKEEEENEDKDKRMSISKVKYNAMLEDEIEALSKEYTEETGLEVTSVHTDIFRREAREELDKKYAVA